MKKFVLFLLLFVSFSNVCIGARWIEIGYKQYVDYDSIELDGFIASAWFKDLNPGNWELYNGKKIYYMLQKVDVDCKNKKVGLRSVAYYGLKNNLLTPLVPEQYSWMSVIPDSMGEYKFKVMCKPFADKNLI